MSAHHEMILTRNNTGVAHENGSIEGPHTHLKSCKSWYSTWRTVSDDSRTGLVHCASAGRAAVKSGASGAPLRGCGT